MLLTSCGSRLPLTSQILAPGKQQTSLDCTPGRHMGASVPFSRESPTTSTRHVLLQLLLCAAGAASPCESCSWFLSSAKASMCCWLVHKRKGSEVVSCSYTSSETLAPPSPRCCQFVVEALCPVVSGGQCHRALVFLLDKSQIIFYFLFILPNTA